MVALRFETDWILVEMALLGALRCREILVPVRKSDTFESFSFSHCLLSERRKRREVCGVCVYLRTDGSWLAGLRQGNYRAL